MLVWVELCPTQLLGRACREEDWTHWLQLEGVTHWNRNAVFHLAGPEWEQVQTAQLPSWKMKAT